MSYRELRNFTEMLRTIGYPRVVSIENFRTPNFELVADILYWMVKKYDPESNISDRVEFESERIDFLTSIEALMSSKARLKLNTKKLYAADGRAVQEMLKISSLLYRAIQLASKSEIDDTSPPAVKLQEVKVVRTLASEITQSGAKLFDLLSTEPADRQDRLKALRFLDATASASEGSREYAFIERSLREAIEASRQRVEDMKKECEELEADERNIKSKIARKHEELERTEKRLRSLDNVRPAFMEEVDKLERDLEQFYEIYIDKYRNLDYLENELDKYRKQEEERQEQQAARVKKMRERLLKEEVELLRGGYQGRDNDDDDMRNGNKQIKNGQTNGKGGNESKSNGMDAAARGKNGANPAYSNQPYRHNNVKGNMLGPSSDDDDDDDSEEEVDDAMRDRSEEDLSVGSDPADDDRYAAAKRGGGNAKPESKNAYNNGGYKAAPARRTYSREDEDDDDDDDDEDDEIDGNVSEDSDDRF